ncbi:hypothetical protein N0V90_008908 [Kalmusia sp. IMI 367209]|nr:hypothetical protein N0V90_008908 [Kalmusia sp. IMI 367209]
MLFSPIFLASLAAAVYLPKPKGPYNVGFTQHIFNHSTPSDPTPGPANIFLTSIYYPTLSEPSPNNSVPYFDPTSAVIWGDVFRIAPSDLLSLESTLQWQAPLLPSEKAEKVKVWPTLVFGPGGGVNAYMYTSLLSELASQGYTILALDHPGEAPYLPLPYNNSGVTGWDIYMPYTDELIQEIYDFRLGDILALLSEDAFPALVELYGAYFNTKKYGVFGQSMGAAQGTGAMGRLDSIVAGFNIDGGLFGDSVNSSLHGRPYFMVNEPINHAEDASWESFVAKYAAEGGWLDWVTVEGAAHLALSDISLWVELLPKVPNSTDIVNLGNVTGSRTDAFLKTYVGAFWKWVRGGKYDEVLEGPSEEWPEVVFNRTIRPDGYKM